MTASGKEKQGTSLVFQPGLGAFTARAWVQSLAGELRFASLVAQPLKKKKRRNKNSLAETAGYLPIIQSPSSSLRESLNHQSLR